MSVGRNNAKIMNQPAWMVGGSGLTIGGNAAINRFKQIEAHGNTQHRFTIFRHNGVGGIGGQGANNSRTQATSGASLIKLPRWAKVVVPKTKESGWATEGPIICGRHHNSNKCSYYISRIGWIAINRISENKFYSICGCSRPCAMCSQCRSNNYFFESRWDGTQIFCQNSSNEWVFPYAKG